MWRPYATQHGLHMLVASRVLNAPHKPAQPSICSAVNMPLEGQARRVLWGARLQRTVLLLHALQLLQLRAHVV